MKGQINEHLGVSAWSDHRMGLLRYAGRQLPAWKMGGSQRRKNPAIKDESRNKSVITLIQTPHYLLRLSHQCKT